MAPNKPLYQGVKFIPKLPHKFSAETSEKVSNVSTLPLEEILKSRPVCLQKSYNQVNKSSNEIPGSKKPTILIRSASGKSASFKQSKPVNSNLGASSSFMTNNNNKSKLVNNTHLIKPAKSDQNLDSANTSSILETNNRLNDSKTRKRTDTSKQNGNFLHTEVRALRRNEYDQMMKDRERQGALIKQELEAKELKRQMDEIQRLRMARSFKSNPIKHYNKVEVKPSERPLTEPKTPPLSASNTRLNRYDSMRSLSSSICPYDRPNYSRFRSQSKNNNTSLVVENGLVNSSRKLAVSHDDLRLKY